MKDQRFVEFAPKVDVLLEPERVDTQVMIQLKDGSELASQVVSIPKGHPDNALTTPELIDRYRDCMEHGPRKISAARIEDIKDHVLNLETVADIGQLMGLLA